MKGKLIDWSLKFDRIRLYSTLIPDHKDHFEQRFEATRLTLSKHPNGNKK